MLRENEIDTIIFTAGVYTDELAEVQFRLIDAAVQCGTVKRFVPSEFGADNVKAAQEYYLLSTFHGQALIHAVGTIR